MSSHGNMVLWFHRTEFWEHSIGLIDEECSLPENA
jgi:hypothetical protein